MDESVDDLVVGRDFFSSSVSLGCVDNICIFDGHIKYSDIKLCNLGYESGHLLKSFLRLNDLELLSRFYRFRLKNVFLLDCEYCRDCMVRVLRIVGGDVSGGGDMNLVLGDI